MPPKKSVQLSGVVVAQTSICSIDAERGVLMYRGYDIADLAEHATYEDVAYLLLEGELPSGEASAAFREELSARELPPPAAAIVDGRARESAPMEMLRTAVSSLSFTDPAEAAIDRENERRKAAQLIAQLPDDRRALPAAPRGTRRDRARSRALVLRELPHDAARRVADGAGGARLRRRDDPARRARDERFDVHGARRRRDALGHPLGRRRGDLRAQGPDPRRREREGDGVLRGDRLARGRCRRGARPVRRARRRSTASAIRSTRRWIRVR